MNESQRAIPVSAAAQRDAQILAIQSEMFNYCGQIKVAPVKARRLLRALNRLRAQNGWKPATLRGRNCAA